MVYLLLTKLFFGKEALGAMVLWMILSVIFAFTVGLSWQLALLGLCAVFFARYPDADIVFHLMRRELLRHAIHAKRISSWWAGRVVTAGVACLSLVSLTLVPIGVLAFLGASIPLAVVNVLIIGILCATVRAWQFHETRIGSHWLYGHYPFLLIATAAIIGFQLEVLAGASGWYLATLFSLATLWHFFGDSMQEDLGVPWLAPLSMGVHLTASSKVVPVDSFYRSETKEFYARLPNSWWEELRHMALHEGGE